MRVLWLGLMAMGCAVKEPAVAPALPESSVSPARCEWARGWASDTVGGRNGRLVRVTTLNAAGPGSLSEALSAAGPRTVVFEVGGVIDLGLATLKIKEPYVTVAGQTAPSPGITLVRGSISVATHDVVLQHLRVRPGTAGQPIGWQPDGISSTSGTHHFIVDHCSLSWAVDENLSASGSRFSGTTPDEWRKNTSHQVTFSHNIVAEGLAHATHEKGEHSKGSLIHDNVTGVLVYGNLYASNTERSPFFKGGARGVVANNWVVNPGKYAMKYTLVADEWTGHEPERGAMSVVGNLLRYGKNTPSGMPLLYSSGIGACDVYLNDNVALDQNGAAAPLVGGERENLQQVATAPVWPPGFEAEPARGLAERLAPLVGARPWDRDSVDTRIVQQALDGSSSLIDSEAEVGGYPQVAPTSAPFVDAEWNLDCMTRR